MDIFEQLGPAALGSRLRRVSELVTGQAGEVYQLYGTALEPYWFPVFYTVATQPGQHVSEIAERIGQTHAAVSQVVKELVRNELVVVQRGETDQRRSVVTLTPKGEEIWLALQPQIADMSRAIDELLAETRHNIWLAIGELEYALSRNSLANRVKTIRSERIKAEVRILDYQPQYQEDFKRLNLEWIEKYFRVEQADINALDHADEYILGRGGHILLAEYQGAIVGACALIKMDDETYELAKMAVSGQAQGLGIGMRLGEAAIAKARKAGARRLYLESNTKLEAALNLYHKLGFRKTVAGPPSPYERCDIQMELAIGDDK